MYTVGVVMHHNTRIGQTNPVLAAIMDGILSVATRVGASVRLITYQDWSDSIRGLSIITDGVCDGVVLVAPPADNALVPALIDRAMPFVMVGAHSDDPRVSYVDIDNIDAARKAVGYVVSQGHRRIAFMSDIGGAHQFVDERLQGFRDAMRIAGAEVEADRIVVEGNVDADLENLVLSGDESRRPTALFCATDGCALVALQALKKLGIRVPDDLSVVGFDDVPFASLSFPPLTTVRQSSGVAGARACEILFEVMKTGAVQKSILGTEVVVRGSVRPAVPAQ